MPRGARRLLKDHLRDVQGVEGPARRGVAVLLGGHAGVVLDQGQRLEQHRGDVWGKAVLHLPFQLHPPVLKPGSDLRGGETRESAEPGGLVGEFPRKVCT